MFTQTCDVCGKTVSWRDGIKVSYPSMLARFEFCEECGAVVVGFLKEKQLLDKEKRLIRF